MSTPNPVLVAAAPVLAQALTDVKAAITTILTGDIEQIPLRVGPAVQILDGQLALLLPELGQVEEPVVLTDATNALDNLISKLQNLQTTTTASTKSA